MRIRVGINHPGNKDLVTAWVLTKFSKQDKDALDNSFYRFLRAVDMLSNNNLADAQLFLHTSEKL